MPTLIDNQNFNIVFKPCLLGEIPAVGTYVVDFNVDLENCPSAIELDATSFNLTSCAVVESPVNFNLTECLISGQILVKGYTGQSASVEIFHLPVFESENYNGQDSESTLAVTLSLDVTYPHGQESDLDLITFPQILIDSEALNGQESVTSLQANYDLKLDSSYHGNVLHDFNLTVAEFDSIECETFTGESSTAELENSPAFESENYNGQESFLEIETDAVALIEVDFYNGSDSYCFITNPDLLETINYTGQSSDHDLTTDLVLEFEAIATNGQESDVDISRTLSIYPRGYNGQDSDADFTTVDPVTFEVTFENGQVQEVDTLTEDEWHFKGYTGQSSDIPEISVALAMEFLANTGQSSDLENLAFQATLDVQFENGQSSEFDELFIHLGEEFEAIGYHGQWFEAEDDIKIYQIFQPHIIQAGQFMYDGWGGVGGLNFCTTTQDWSMEYDFNASQYDREPWGYCGSKTFIQMDIDLLTNPRFEFDGYTGQSVESAIPQKFLGFGIDDDDPRLHFTPILYLKPSDEIEVVFHNGQSSVEMNSHPDDFLAINSQSCVAELTVQPIVEFEFGQSLEVDVSFDESDWKRGFQRGGNSQYSYFEFEPNECVRFCKGYLVPVGDQVTFDFASINFLDCYSYLASTGEFSEVDLSVSQALPIDFNYHGQQSIIGKFTDNILYPKPMYNGQSAHIYNGERIEATEFNNGQMMFVELERRGYDGSNGASAMLYNLAEAQPTLRINTPSGCLENQYIPLTPDGDLDLTFEQIGACVEFEPFWTRIEGECLDIYTYKTYFHQEVMYVAGSSECSLATESSLELNNTSTGADVIFEFD